MKMLRKILSLCLIVNITCSLNSMEPVAAASKNRGLTNSPAFTCFMNSTLQALSHVDELTELLRQQANPNEFIKEYLKLVTELKKTGNAYNPNLYKEKILKKLFSADEVQKAVQQDAQEHLCKLLDAFAPNPQSTLEQQIKRIFGIGLSSVIECANGHTKTSPSTKETTLELQVKNFIGNTLGSLKECLDDAFKPAQMTWSNPAKPETDNRYACEACGKKVDAKTRQVITKLSDTLIIHLKRFEKTKVTVFLKNYLTPPHFLMKILI